MSFNRIFYRVEILSPKMKVWTHFHTFTTEDAARVIMTHMEEGRRKTRRMVRVTEEVVEQIEAAPRTVQEGAQPAGQQADIFPK